MMQCSSKSKQHYPKKLEMCQYFFTSWHRRSNHHFSKSMESKAKLGLEPRSLYVMLEDEKGFSHSFMVSHFRHEAYGKNNGLILPCYPDP